MSVQQETSSIADTSTAEWLSVSAIALGAFALVTTEFLPVGLLPAIASEFGTTRGEAGLMLTAPGLIATVAGPAIMVAAGSIDRRSILLLLSLGLLVSSLVSALTSNFPLLLAARALLGCCIGGFWTVALATAGGLVRERSAMRAVAIVISAITAATVVGVPLGTYVGSLLSWRASFFCTAVLGATGLVAQLLAVPSVPAKQSMRWASLGNMLKRPRALNALFATQLIIAAHIAAYTYIAPFLIDNVGLSPLTVPYILLGFGAVGFVGNLVVGRFAEHHLRNSLLVIMFGLSASFLFLPFVTVSVPVTMLLIAIWAAGNGAQMLCLTTWVGATMSDHPEAGSALFVSAIQISIAVGAVVGGIAVDYLGIPRNMTLGFLLAAAGCLSVILQPRGRSEGV